MHKSRTLMVCLASFGALVTILGLLLTLVATAPNGVRVPFLITSAAFVVIGLGCCLVGLRIFALRFLRAVSARSSAATLAAHQERESDTTNELYRLGERMLALETGQRRTMNFLRKEGSIDVVLQRVQASERRLLSSYERGSLSAIEELSRLFGQATTDAKKHVDTVLEMINANESDRAACCRRDGEAVSLLGELENDLSRIRHDVETSVALLSGLRRDVLNLDSREWEEGMAQQVSELGKTVREIQGGSERASVVATSLSSHMDSASVDVVRQVESLFHLFGRADVAPRGFPLSGGWAMNADSLFMLARIIGTVKPRCIVELGSGTSTIWVGKFAQEVGARVVSLEHSKRFAEQTRTSLLEFDLRDTAEVWFAELAPISLNGVEYQWYDLEFLASVGEVDMVIVDGPPKSTGVDSRFPAFPVLKEYLTENALIIVDDINRRAEREMVDRWKKLEGALVDTGWAASRTGVYAYRSRPLGE